MQGRAVPEDSNVVPSGVAYQSFWKTLRYLTQELHYSRGQKVGTVPSSDPQSRERRNTTINHPKSLFQLVGVLCRVSR